MSSEKSETSRNISFGVRATGFLDIARNGTLPAILTLQIGSVDQRIQVAAPSFHLETMGLFFTPRLRFRDRPFIARPRPVGGGGRARDRTRAVFGPRAIIEAACKFGVHFGDAPTFMALQRCPKFGRAYRTRFRCLSAVEAAAIRGGIL